MSTESRAFPAILTLLLGTAVACSLGGNTSSEEPDSGESSANSTRSAAEPSATVVSNDAGEDGAPNLAQGSWTGGEAEVRVNGSDPRTITGQILESSSLTEGGSTILTYAGGPTGIDTINISFSTDDERFIVGAYQEEGFLDIAIPFGQPGCEVTYQETSDNRIEGTFRCEGAEIHRANRPPEAVVMEGSFSATR